MDLSTVLGFIIGVISIFGIACQLELAPYINIPSIGLVFGGAASSVFMSLPLKDALKMPRTFWQAFKAEEFDSEAMIRKMVTFAEGEAGHPDIYRPRVEVVMTELRTP